MNRFIKTTIVTSLIAISAYAYAADKNNHPATTAATPAEKAKIEAVVHDYLISKPEVLVEAMQVLQEKQFQQAQQTVKQTQKAAATYANDLFHQSTDPIAGNPDGKITIVEFFDYQCPHCIDMAPTMDAVIKANPDVRVIYKDFPIRGPLSELAARAALAAQKQGKYHELSNAMLTANKQLTQDVILEIAKNQGLDVDKLKQDMKDSAIDNQLKANTKLAQNLKLLGTPAFFIGKTSGKGNINYVPGQMDQKQLQLMIDNNK
ncbi:MAG: DsbA family protein [Gammaproteobacteria bacterium]|nr:DsbA family protein [Gammaproteobacteria bacterium]